MVDWTWGERSFSRAKLFLSDVTIRTRMRYVLWEKSRCRSVIHKNEASWLTGNECSSSSSDASINAVTFNESLARWSVLNAATMEGMFAGASNFNQPLFCWNVSQVSTNQLQALIHQASLACAVYSAMQLRTISHLTSGMSLRSLTCPFYFIMPLSLIRRSTVGMSLQSPKWKGPFSSPSPSIMRWMNGTYPQ